MFFKANYVLALQRSLVSLSINLICNTFSEAWSFKAKQKTTYSKTADGLILPFQGIVCNCCHTSVRVFKVYIQAFKWNPLWTNNLAYWESSPAAPPLISFVFALTKQGSSVYLDVVSIELASLMLYLWSKKNVIPYLWILS